MGKISRFLIADKVVEIEGELHKSVYNVLQEFIYKGDCDSDVRFLFKSVKCSFYGINCVTFSDCKGGSPEKVYFSKKDSSYFTYSLTEDYSINTIFVGDTFNFDAFMEVFMFGFLSYLSLKGYVLLHASAFLRDCSSVVFIGDSGVGKTTQAEIWKKCLGGSILNGDKIFLKSEDGKVVSYGNPWKGSSDYYKQGKGYVVGLLSLSHGKENAYIKRDGLLALELILRSTFIPKWDDRCEEMVYNSVSAILESSSVYSYECTPDASSVEYINSKERWFK